MEAKNHRIKRRTFLKNTAIIASGMAVLPSLAHATARGETLRTAHIGVGGMGMEDLNAMASHAAVEVKALCDVDKRALDAAQKLFPEAKAYSDYRLLLREMKDEIDAVVVSTPDHTHAPASLQAMELDKSVYCQKPLSHHVSEARAMRRIAEEKNLTTQMGIQVHSFYDYRLATLLIQSGIIGKIHTVRAWSPKNWGYDGPVPEGSDPIPAYLDWNLWLGTAAKRPYKEGIYHPGNWRKLVDYGCGTLGDMGVHIFDTPYNALQLDIPRTIKNECRAPNDFGFPEENVVTYEFPGTEYTAETLTWVWYDGAGAPARHEELILPEDGVLPDQGAMFVGEKGRLLLPHFMQLPQLIVDDAYVDISQEVAALEKAANLGAPIRDYAEESKQHYHQFVDACLGKGTCTAPFSYAARLTETILLGVIAGRFPNQTLHWNAETLTFDEEEANVYLSGTYREF